MSSSLFELTKQAVFKLERWFLRNGWAGYDPYDLKGCAFYHRLHQLPSPFNKLMQIVVNHEEFVRPKFWRKVLCIPKKINANTVALLARAYLQRHAVETQVNYLIKTQQCLDWLANNNALSSQKKKLGWGYPFTWYSGSDGLTILPPNTALSVVTTEGGHAFLDLFDICKDKQALENAKRCSRFLLEDLPREKVDSDRVCFGYTSQGHFVVNANLNIAAYLSRVSSYIQDSQMLSIARKARRLAVSLQNKDGSWYYWVHPEEHTFGIDSYHTGMILQWLWVCQQYDPEPDDNATLTRGLNFYSKEFFSSNGRPYLTVKNDYPIDIHCPAQALVTLGLLASDYPDICFPLMEKVIQWTIDHMSNRDGSFMHQIYPDRRVRIPYTRWGQAWMMWGLSVALSVLNKLKSPVTQV